MSRFLFTALGTAVLLGALSPLALAGEPDPNASECDLILAVSPKNNLASLPVQFRYVYECILKDNTGQVVPAFSRARMKFDHTGCVGASTCPNQITADTDSDLNGVMQWSTSLNCGGALTCGPNILKDDVLFKNLPDHAGLPNASLDGGRRSPDEDGGGTVALPDLSIFRAELNGVNNPRRDYQGDVAPPFNGLTDLNDLSTFRAHLNAT